MDTDNMHRMMVDKKMHPEGKNLVAVVDRGMPR